MFCLGIELIVLLFLILFSAHLFTNALESFSDRLNLSANVTGSLLAAIATALPETLIPFLAIVAGSSNVVANEKVSLGAIVGSSFMLSTLSVFCLCIALIRKRKLNSLTTAEISGFKRDLHFFMFATSIACLSMFIPSSWLIFRHIVTSVLLLNYLIYILLVCFSSKKLVAAGHGVEANEMLIFKKWRLVSENLTGVFVQLLFALVLLVLCAKYFVVSIENLSDFLHLSPLLLALFVIPIATELPEKFNSINWIRNNKDTLAMANITGALVFQGSLLPAMGISMTSWHPDNLAIGAIIFTLLACLWLRWHAEELKVKHLYFNGALYFIFMFSIIFFYL